MPIPFSFPHRSVDLNQFRLKFLPVQNLVSLLQTTDEEQLNQEFSSQGGSMPQEKNKDAAKSDTPQPRNESAPGKTPVGTSTTEEINAENSPEVSDALSEPQV